MNETEKQPGVYIGLRLSEDVAKKLKEIARGETISVSAAIRRILAKALTTSA